jgi:proteasome lid subunit RPN8/RPN11
MRVPLEIEQQLWRELIAQLKQRGRGDRESGAFLLGPAGSDMVTRFICYDDLDPYALQGGVINFNGNGFVPLWKTCSEELLKVQADVHTHPGEWTGQSGVDQANPMILQAGHIALIVPAYAQLEQQLLEGVGAYEYLGSKRWKTFPHAAAIIKFKAKEHGIFRKFFQSLIDRFDRKKWFWSRRSAATTEKL